MASSESTRGGLAKALDLMRRGALQEAATLLEALHSREPGDVAITQLQAQVASRRGDPHGALAHLLAASHLAPGSSEVRFQLACLQAHTGQLPAAIGNFDAVVQDRPGFAPAWHFLGLALTRAGREREALRALRQAHALAPEDPAMLRALADLEFRAGWPADALPLWQVLLSRDPDDTGARLRTGETLHRLGDQDAAVACFRAGVAQQPGNAGLWLALGQAEEDAGDRDAAREAYQRALALRPDWPFALACLLALLRGGAPAEQAARAGALLDGGTQGEQALDDGDRALLGYALGKVHEARGEHAPAMARWQEANAARRRVAGEPDPSAIRARVDAIIAAHGPGAFTSPIASPAKDDERFVFVVGMPRSGTTLTEQILASHPRVHGCGELPDLAMLASRLGDAPPGTDALRGAVARFEAAATRHAPAGVRRLVDKEPLDFLHLGLVARLFPQARVVWCRRDPRDVALSIFGENFALDEPWATRLDAIGHFIVQHERLMRHWQSVLPLPILECRYEDLVADTEAQARRLVAFAGLDWDPACLAFHEHARAVQSPSRWQVREPVHARSVGRWRHHADALAPLLAGLDAAGADQETRSAQASTPSRWTSGS